VHKITVAALGPGDEGCLTLGAVKAMKEARQLVLRTSSHGAAGYLASKGIAFDTLDDFYEQSEDFDRLADAAAQELIRRAASGPVCFGVADPAADTIVLKLLERAGDQLHILPGVSLEAPFLADRPDIGPVVVTDALSLSVYDAQRPVCLTELASRELAGSCKLQLLEYFDADSTLIFFPPNDGSRRKGLVTTLEELDRQPGYHHSCGALLLPKKGHHKERYDVQDLVGIMRLLRAPEGCPWDREQTHRSLARYLIEEANEAAYAIAQEDWEAVADELGDVLLQVVFHAVIGEERGTMTLSDISTAICSKLINRHRHIFGGDQLKSAREVTDSWEKIKEEERGHRTLAQKMRALAPSLPPLLRSVKVQETAAKAGFDWNDPRDAIKKVHEEAGELLQDLDAGRDGLDELGDLFFAVVNVARLMGMYPDEVVNNSTDKFINRFEFMEKAIKRDEKASKYLTLDEWDVYWNRSKQAE
jgi:tetrapyrrole methylase family protein/MazG family protein